MGLLVGIVGYRLVCIFMNARLAVVTVGDRFFPGLFLVMNCHVVEVYLLIMPLNNYSYIFAVSSGGISFMYYVQLRERRAWEGRNW